MLGMSISLVPNRVIEIRQQLRDLREVLTSHVAGTDDPAGDESILNNAAAQIVALRAELARLPEVQTLLRLTPVDGGNAVTLVAAPSNATQVQFVNPRTLFTFFRLRLLPPVVLTPAVLCTICYSCVSPRRQLLCVHF